MGNIHIPDEKDNKIFIVCPFCKGRCPYISLNGSNGKMFVFIKCSCMKLIGQKEDKEKVMEIRDFIQSLQEIASCSSYDSNINICQEHFQPFTVYCNRCKLNLCPICLKIHQSNPKPHRLLALRTLSSSNIVFQCSFTQVSLNEINRKTTKILESIENKINVFLETKDYIIKETQGIIQPSNNAIAYVQNIIGLFNNYKSTPEILSAIDYRINNYLHIRDTIKEIYQSITLINEDLMKFLQYLYNTINAYKNHPTHELMILAKNIKAIPINSKGSFDEMNMNEIHNSFLFETMNDDITDIFITETYPINYLLQLITGELVSGCSNGSINIWNVDTLVCVNTFQPHSQSITCIIQLKDSGEIVSGAEDGLIQISNIWTGEHTAITTGSSIIALIELENGEIASALKDLLINVWNTTTLECIGTMIGHTSNICDMRKLRDGHLVSCSHDKTIRVWNPTTYQNITVIHDYNYMQCVIELSNGKLAGGSYLNIIIWDRQRCQKEITLQGHESYIKSLDELSNNIFASYAGDYTIKLWDIKSMTCVYTFKGHYDSINKVIEFTNEEIASCSTDKTIRFWEYNHLS